MRNINKAKEAARNNTSFKKLLATASTLAMITGASSSAEAELYKTNGVADVTLETGVVPANVLKSDDTAADAWAANDSFFWAHNNLALILGSPGNATDVATLDLHGANGTSITVAEDSTIGSIVDTGGTGPATLKVNDGRTLTFGNVIGKSANNVDHLGGDYAVVEAITLGDADVAAANLVIDVATGLDCTIDSQVL